MVYGGSALDTMPRSFSSHEENFNNCCEKIFLLPSQKSPYYKIWSNLEKVSALQYLAQNQKSILARF